MFYDVDYWNNLSNVTSDFVRQMSLFDNADSSFIKMLSKFVKPQLYRATDYIVRKHDTGSDVYFIHQGQLVQLRLELLIRGSINQRLKPQA